MVCNKCGTEVLENDKFCPKCGAKVTIEKEYGLSESEGDRIKEKEIKQLSTSFVSRDEEYIASLGNGYILNFLANKSVSKGFAFLTNKRVYFKGSCLIGTGKKLVKTDEERIVDVKNITGSGFVYQTDWGKIVRIVGFAIAIIGFIIGMLLTERLMWSWISLVIAGLIVAIGYLLERKTYFSIEYAGGCIAFDVSFYAKAEIDDFQKQLRRTKDLAEETATVRTVTAETQTQASVQAPVQNSVPDELRKYADLLKEGLISQEEYDAMKKKILGL